MNKTMIPAAMSAIALAGAAVAAPAPQPVEKIPQPETPVLMIGDSMMRLLGHEMEKAFKKAGVQPAVSFSSLGSGLVRPSAFNWPSKITELITAEHPSTVFVCLGANDRQPIELADGGNVRYEDAAEWRATYSKIIGSMMDQLIAGDVKRIIWMLLPDMKDSVNQEHAKLVNEIVAEQAADEKRKDFITLYDLASALSRRPGKFTQYMMSPTGQSLTVRDPDGVHLSVDGGKLVAQKVLKEFWNK